MNTNKVFKFALLTAAIFSLNSAMAQSRTSTILGVGANSADSLGGTSIGALTLTQGFSVAVGESATATSLGGVAIGNGAVAIVSGPSQGVGATAIGSSSTASGNGSTAVGYDAKVSGLKGSALGVYAVVNATAENSVAIGANSIADVSNTVSFGGNGSTRTLTNISNGVAATDAATIGQLNAAIAAVPVGATGAQGIQGVKGDTGAQGIAGNNGVNATTSATGDSNMPDGGKATSRIVINAKDEVGTYVSRTAIGDGMQTLTGVATSASASLTVQNGAGKTQGLLVAEQLTTLSGGAHNPTVITINDGGVSFSGSNNQNVLLRGVGSPVQQTDAANKDYVDNAIAPVANQAARAEFTANEALREIGGNRKLSSQGIAAALATQTLIQDVPVGKTAVGVGTGFYDGESAIGLSVAHSTLVDLGVKNEKGAGVKTNILFSGGVSASGGNVAVRAGASIVF